MNRFGYWISVILLAALTFVSFRFTMMQGRTAAGTYGLFVTLFLFAVLLGFSISMRDRHRRSRPIPR